MVGVLGITSKKSLPVFRLQKYYPIFPRSFVLATFLSMSAVHLELFGGVLQGAVKVHVSPDGGSAALVPFVKRQVLSVGLRYRFCQRPVGTGGASCF